MFNEEFPPFAVQVLFLDADTAESVIVLNPVHGSRGIVFTHYSDCGIVGQVNWPYSKTSGRLPLVVIR